MREPEVAKGLAGRFEPEVLVERHKLGSGGERYQLPRIVRAAESASYISLRPNP